MFELIAAVCLVPACARFRPGLAAGTMLFLLCGGAAAAPLTREDAAELQVVSAGLAHDALFDIEFEGNDGLAVGDHGLLLATHDGGASWAPLAGVPTDKALLGLALRQDRAIIVGQEGTILLGDERTGWRQVDGGGAGRLLNVALNDDGLSVAVGEFGTVLLLRDAGESWVRPAMDWDAIAGPDGYEPHLYDVKIDARGRVLIAGEFGLVLSSDDGCRTWQVRHQGESSLFGLHMNAAGTGFAVGQEGTVLRSQDFGDSWQQMPVPAAGNLLGAWNSSHGEVVVVGIRTLLRSSDDGASWTESVDPAIRRSWYQALSAGQRSLNVGDGTVTRAVVFAAGQRASILQIGR